MTGSPLIALLLLTPLAAQQPSDLFEKAPPAIDEALRARVAKFFQYHVDGKFRLADALVAEESKDVFFEAEKKRYYSCGISRITYSDNFTRAKALVACESDFNAGFRIMRVQMPVTSLWKVEKGEWFWYAPPPSKEYVTPFGVMRPAPNSDAAPGALPMNVNDPAQMALAAQRIAKQVSADRQEAQLSSFQAASDRITITNAMQGSVELSVEHLPLAGFSATLDRKELKAGEAAHLDLKIDPADKRPKETMTVKVHVSPTAQVIPIKVTFPVPEALTPGRVR